MRKQIDPFTVFSLGFIGLILLSFVAAACVGSTDEQVVDPGAKYISTDGTTLHEVHPRSGVTCYIVYQTGLSCFKD
jgi:hypothetical protein